MAIGRDVALSASVLVVALLMSEGFSLIREALQCVSPLYRVERDNALEALDAVEARLADAERDRNGLQHFIDCANTPLMADVLRDKKRLEEALRRAAYVAEHLHQMIPQDVWRAHGAEWQGHYEGDKHAYDTQQEIEGWKALSGREAPCEHDWVTEHGSATQWCVTCGAGREAPSRPVESHHDRYAIEHPDGNWHVEREAPGQTEEAT